MDRVIFQNLLNICNDLFDCCIRIFKPDGTLLAATKKEFSDFSSPSFSRTIEINDIPLCDVAIWSQEPEPVFNYIKAALELASSYHNDISQEYIMKKMYITNQIIDSGDYFSDMATLTKELRIHLDRFRCAIIIELGWNNDFSFQDQELSNSSSEILTNLYRLFSSDDIFGIVNDRRFVIFKALPQWEADHKAYLEQFIQQIRECFCHALKTTPFFCIGKAYHSLVQLKWSYQEAAFIADNSNLFFSSDTEDTVFIDQCLADYLMSIVPADFLKMQSDKYTNKLTPELIETLKALSWNNFNVSKAALDLNLHRNTVIQRINKIKSNLEIDDLKSIKNKLQFRELSLQYNRKLILHGAITISPHSALFDAFQHFAKLVNKNSNGAIILNVHSLSDSGDNALLFHTLRSGNIDFIVVDTSVLNKVTSNLTAVLDLPLLFDSEKQAFQIMNSLVLSEFNTSLSLSGVSCLAIWSMGWRYLTSYDTPIRIPSDLNGQKIRIMENKTLNTFFKSIGAFPVQMNFSSVYEALASGLIDGQENPCSNIINMKFYKHQTYFTDMNFNFDTEALLVSASTWQKLPKEYKEIIVHSAQETTEWLLNELISTSQEQKNYLRDVCNMILVPVTKQEQALWMEKVSPLYRDFSHKDLLYMIQNEKEMLKDDI